MRNLIILTCLVIFISIIGIPEVLAQYQKPPDADIDYFYDENENWNSISISQNDFILKLQTSQVEEFFEHEYIRIKSKILYTGSEELIVPVSSGCDKPAYNRFLVEGNSQKFKPRNDFTLNKTNFDSERICFPANGNILIKSGETVEREIYWKHALKPENYTLTSYWFDFVNASLPIRIISNEDMIEAQYIGNKTGSFTLKEILENQKNKTHSTPIPDSEQNVPKCQQEPKKDVDLSYCDLKGRDFSDSNLYGANLSFSDLSHANFENALMNTANLTGANIKGTNFTNASLFASILDGLDFTKAIVANTIFLYANLSNAIFPVELIHKINPSMDGINLSGKDLSGLDLTKKKFGSAILRNTNLSGADLSHSYFPSADFANADMSNVKINQTEFTGVNFTNVNIESIDFTQTYYLSRTDFSGKDLSGFNFPYYDFKFTDFSNANLTNTAFPSSNLFSVDLTGATLKNTDFSNAYLRFVKLVDVIFDNTVFENTKLNYVDFSNSDVSKTDLSKVAEIDSSNLSNQMLDGVNFSTIKVRETNFSNSSLQNTNFENSELYRNDFRGSDVQGANFNGVSLTYSDLVGFDLPKSEIEKISSFKRSNLSGWDLSNLDLSNTNFQGSNLTGVNFENTNLRNSTLNLANLQSANLLGADFEGASIWQIDLAPKKQMKFLGLESEEVECAIYLNIIFKQDNSPACVKRESISKLVERGWADKKFFSSEYPETVDFRVDAGEKGVFNVPYYIEGAELEDIFFEGNSNNLIIKIKNSENGHLIISLLRDLIYAKIYDEDHVFFAIIDGEEVPFEEKKYFNERILFVPFEYGTSQIEINSTQGIMGNK